MSDRATTTKNWPVRLDKRVSDGSDYSRSQIVELFRDGRISTSSARITRLHDLIFPDETVFVDGDALTTKERLYRILYKPLNVLTTISDPFGRDGLASFCVDGLKPVGRLDRDTSGLLILTNDGDLNQALLNPTSEVPRRYILGLRRPVERITPDLGLLGLDIDDQWVDFVTLGWASKEEVPERMPGICFLSLTLAEGRNRIVRRIAKRRRWRLKALHRVEFGGILLGGISIGETRELEDHEVERLWHMAGGQSRLLQKRLADLTYRASSESFSTQEREKLQGWLDANT